MAVTISYTCVETGSEVECWLNLSQEWKPWSLCQDDLTADLLLICDNSRRVLVHQAVLLPLSTFLQDLVPVCCPCTVPAITLCSVNETALNTLVELIYRGRSRIGSEEEKIQFEEMIKNLQIELVTLKAFASEEVEDSGADFKKQFPVAGEIKLHKSGFKRQRLIDENSILAESSSKCDLQMKVEGNNEDVETKLTTPSKTLDSSQTGKLGFEVNSDTVVFSEKSSDSRDKSHLSRTVPAEMHSNSESLFKCAGCNLRSTNSEDLSRHVKDVHKMNRCQICGKWLKRLDALDRHIKVEHFKNEKLKKNTCKHCGKEFLNKFALTEHKTIHLRNPKMYTCLLCDFSSCRKTLMASHVKNEHATEQSDTSHSFSCYVCNKTLNSFTELKPHVFIHVALGETSEIEMTLNLHDLKTMYEEKQAEENKRKQLVKKMLNSFMK